MPQNLLYHFTVPCKPILICIANINNTVNDRCACLRNISTIFLESQAYATYSFTLTHLSGLPQCAPKYVQKVRKISQIGTEFCRTCLGLRFFLLRREKLIQLRSIIARDWCKQSDVLFYLSSMHQIYFLARKPLSLKDIFLH